MCVCADTSKRVVVHHIGSQCVQLAGYSFSSYGARAHMRMCVCISLDVYHVDPQCLYHLVG